AALYYSLRRHCGVFLLWVLCLDEATQGVLERIALPNITLISLATLERHDPQLKECRDSRPLIEYYYTCTPSIVHFLLKQHAEIELLTYLDADLFFFDSPEPVFEEMENSSIALIPHRDSPRVAHLA